MGPKESCSSSTWKEKRSLENCNRIEEVNNCEVRVSISLRNTAWQDVRFQNFLENKEAIKAADVAKGVSIVHSKQRPQIMDEVEKLRIYDDLIKQRFATFLVP